MALYTAAVAGDGRLHRPWLLRDVPDLPALRWRSMDDRRGTWGRALPAGTAAAVRRAMVVSARDGWAAAARVGRAPGFDLGAKTGTAELDTGEPHAWTIGFAPAERPVVAVAVLVVGGGQGAEVAAPIAGAVLEQALEAAR
jgi:peptidoglycan glycosyltransferase